MVLSKINKKVSYTELKTIDENDKGRDVSMYKIFLFKIPVIIALGDIKYTYVKQGVLTARREEAANNNKKIKDGRNINKNKSNRFDQQQQQQYQNDTMYGINDIELNIKYENEIGDKYVGHHDTITNARNLTERLKRHNDNTQRKDANRKKKTKKTKKKKKEKKNKRSKDV